jgi:hypothetical protein
MAGDRMAFGAANITGPGEERRQPEHKCRLVILAGIKVR